MIKMKRGFPVLWLAIACAAVSSAQDKSPLRLVTTIPLPGVGGRFDHSAVDLEGQWLFITGRDANTLEVIDLRAGQHVQSLPGFPQPQGAYYVPFAKKLFVSTRDDGACKIIDGNSLKIIDSIKLSVGANVIAYDSAASYLYIGHGGRQVGDAPTVKRDPGQIAIVDAASGRLIGNIETDPDLRPGAIVVEQLGPRLFTTNALGSQIVIIDREKRTILAKWPLPSAERSGTVALDEIRHRLFVGMRNPSRVIVFDADSGKQITSFPTVAGIDRLLYDAANKWLYSTGSAKSGEHEGSIEVYRQVDADHYELITKMATGPDGGTSLLVPETGRLYVALPRYEQRNAEIRVYDTRP
jgi:DNA-binding beta-propeller fold protein YncE